MFAPSNVALQAFLDSNGYSNFNEVPVTLLRQTLLYHILSSEVLSTSFSDGYIKTSGNNSVGEALDLYVEIGTQVTLNQVELDMDNLDNEVDNGVIHALDGLLTIPTITTLIAANPEFSNLETALLQENILHFLRQNQKLCC